jgi:hypothetical protein
MWGLGKRPLWLQANGIESLARASHVFRDIFDIHLHWRGKVFRFQTSRSWVISLADYTGEKPVIMNVPHRMLLGKEETVPAEVSQKAT